MSSHTERQKKYLAKLKGCIGKDEYKEKELRRCKLKRQENLYSIQEKDREKQKWYQEQKKKAVKTNITSPAYKTTSTLTRAIRKAEESLPNSPRKKSQAVQKLFEESCCSTSRSPAKTLGRPSLSQEIVTMVENFYTQDDISIVVCTDVRKETSQRSYLFMTVAEPYNLFREKHPNECIGKSKFAKLQPKHVLLSNDLPVNVCNCRYHQNFMLLCEAMHKFQSDFPLSSHDLPPSLVCNENSDYYWNKKCDECKGGKRFMEKCPLFDASVKVTWYISGKRNSWQVERSNYKKFRRVVKLKFLQ